MHRGKRVGKLPPLLRTVRWLAPETEGKRTKAAGGVLPPSKPPPARHRPGARSARRKGPRSMIPQIEFPQGGETCFLYHGFAVIVLRFPATGTWLPERVRHGGRGAWTWNGWKTGRCRPPASSTPPSASTRLFRA